MCSRRWPPSRFLLPITVAILGAGPLGRWLAREAARAGFRVFLEDVMPANLHHAQEALRRELGASVLGRAGSAAGMDESRESRVGAVIGASTIEDAVREADLAIDCVPDELESKLEIFCLLDRMAPPRTVLMTPTTRLSIADLAACTYRADRCIAIAAEAAALTEGSGREVLLRTTQRTSADAEQLVHDFWNGIGFAVLSEVDAG